MTQLLENASARAIRIFASFHSDNDEREFLCDDWIGWLLCIIFKIFFISSSVIVSARKLAGGILNAEEIPAVKYNYHTLVLFHKRILLMFQF